MDCGEQTSQVLDKFLFPKIFRTFSMAIQPSKLIIAFLALAVICTAGRIMDLRKTVVTTGEVEVKITELQIYMVAPGQLQSFIENQKASGHRAGVFSTLWKLGCEKFHNALYSLFAFNISDVFANIADCFKAVGWAFRYHFLYSIIFFILILVAISISGGAICRISALQFARDEKPGMIEAIRFSSKKIVSFLLTPLSPIGLIILVGLLISLLGFLGNIPRAGELIVGIFIPFALFCGVVMAVLLIGMAAGFNLLFPSLAYEGSDCLDVISRCFNYVYAKPCRMGFYTAIAVVYGAICYIFVRFFAFLLLWITHLFLEFGIFTESSSEEVGKLAAIWPEPSFMNLLGTSGLIETNWSESFAGSIVYLFLLVVVGLVISFIISFYFSANTIIYSLMRKKVDNTDLEEIYIEPLFDDTSEIKSFAEPTKAKAEEGSTKSVGSRKKNKK